MMNRSMAIIQTDRQINEASSTNLTLEGGGDAFRLHLKHKTLTMNRSNAIIQIDHQITEAISANLTLEGGGDTFRFHPECETSMAKCMRVIKQTEK
jgi:hypothetical protein